MPAIDPNRNRRAGLKLRKKKAAKKPYTAPAPKSQPGPVSDAERKKVEQHKTTPGYQKAIGDARKQGPATRRGSVRPGGDDKSDADRARGRKVSDAAIRQARIDYLRKHRDTVSVDDLVQFATGGQAGRVAAGDLGSSKVRSARGPASALDQSSPIGALASRGVRGMAEALAHDPVGVSGKTAKGLGESLASIPSGVLSAAVETVEGVKHGDPLRGIKKTGKAYLDDVERRYGPLTHPGGEHEFAKRVQKEGAAGEVLDASTLLTGAGSVAGKAAGAAARAGKLGKAAEKVAAERPKLRVSGGAAVEQRVSPNLIVAGAQKAQDTARRRKSERLVRNAEQNGGRVDALDASRAPDEVVPLRRGKVAGAKHTQARRVARRKGQSLDQMRREQAQHVGDLQRGIASLSADERRAFKVADQLGIRDPETARRILTQHAERIRVERDRAGTKIPKSVAKTNDELPNIERLIADADKAFTPKLGQVVDHARRVTKRVGANDPALSPERRLLRQYAQQAETLGVKRLDNETPAAFVSRVRKAAKKEGLADPGYFPSEKRATVRHSNFAVGGTKTVADDKRYTGTLFRQGREDFRPEVLAQGVAKNIKRKFNWNVVADNVEHEAFDWSKDKSIEQIRDELDRRGIDPNSVALWNPGRYRKAAERGEGEHVDSADELPTDAITAAVDDAGTTFDKLATKPEDFQQSAGFLLVPKGTFDEIHAATRKDGAIARGWDILTAKQARVMLGLSPKWLGTQVASNVALAGLAGVGPVDIAKAQAFFRKLPQAERDAFDDMIGVTSFGESIHQPKMGAAANNRLVNAYRVFKDTAFFTKPRRVLRGKTVKNLNPLDVLFRANAAQDRAFRRAVLYSEAKKAAYKDMGVQTGRMMERQRHITGLLTLGPKDQIRSVVRDRKRLEQHAQAVNDFLGDYTTYTATERKTLKRAAMFYGWLRFSLRLTFWTMPTRHPIVTSILTQLGRLEAEELRELLGEDQLPFALGKFMYTVDGKLKSVDLSSANPAMNALTELRAPKDALNFLPPIVGMAINQVSGQNIYKDRPLRVHGEPDGRKSGAYSLTDRARIALNQALEITAPYRAWEKTVAGVRPMGDDSLPWDTRRTYYDDKDVNLGIDRQAAQDTTPAGEKFAKEFVPFLPRDERAKESGELSRAYKRMDEITTTLDRMKKDGSAESPAGGDYESKSYQRLSDERKALQVTINRLQAKGSPAPRSTTRLLRRPLTPEQQVQQKLDAWRKAAEDPTAEVQKKLDRWRARRAIETGGG